MKKKACDYLLINRIESGMTQSELAKKLGYSTPQFISNVERGLCNPPLKSIKKWTQLVGGDLTEVRNLLVSDFQKKVMTTVR